MSLATVPSYIAKGTSAAVSIRRSRCAAVVNHNTGGSDRELMQPSVNVRRTPWLRSFVGYETEVRSVSGRGYQSRGVWRCAQAQGVSFATSVSTAMSSSTSAT